MTAEPNRDMPGASQRVKVLVVDDSAFMRYIISKELTVDPTVEVVGAARDGIDALHKIGQLKPDVVTMDVEMPRMDGLKALERIMIDDPVPVVLLSSWTQSGATVTIQGLEMGAVDFVAKPSALKASSSEGTWRQLIAKVKDASGMDVHRLKRAGSRARGLAVPQNEVKPSRKRPVGVDGVVVIGASTGGPGALFEIIPRLPATIPAAVLLVQHMPPGFTRSLANRLNDVSQLEVREAAEGDAITAGQVLLAPGNYHMAVRKPGRISLEQSPPLHGVRPAVDVTMESAASVYGSSTIGVVLTGMGRDGTRGALSIRQAGGFVIVEDEATCVVYGMPRSVRDAGAANLVVRLEAVADAICEAASGLRIRKGA